MYKSLKSQENHFRYWPYRLQYAIANRERDLLHSPSGDLKQVFQMDQQEDTPEAGYERWEGFLKAWGPKSRSIAGMWEKSVIDCIYVPDLCSRSPSDALDD